MLKSKPLFKTFAKPMSACLLASVLSLSACGEGGDMPGTSASPDPSASANASVDASASVTLPDPTEIATFTGFKALSCDQEDSLKSSNGPASRVVINNKTDARIKLYWLNRQGERVEYSPGGIAAGASHIQGTFVTHPWVITNEKEECLGIYVPEDSSGATLNVNKNVENVGVTVGGSASTGGSVSAGGIGRAGFVSLMNCYKQKQPFVAPQIDLVLARTATLPDSAFAGFDTQINAARALGCTI